MNGVTSRRRRQRVCSKDEERGRERGEKGETGKSEGRVRLRLLPVIRSALYRRALAPIHHLSVRHQSEAQSEMYTAVGAKG